MAEFTDGRGRASHQHPSRCGADRPSDRSPIRLPADLIREPLDRSVEPLSGRVAPALARSNQRHRRRFQPHPGVPSRRGSHPSRCDLGRRPRICTPRPGGPRPWVRRLAGASSSSASPSSSGREVPLFGRGVVAGLWLAFIGWFLSSAASQTRRRQLVREVLEGVSVSRLLIPPGPVVPAHVDLNTLVGDWMIRSGARAFPVVDDRGGFLGLVTFADLRKVPREAWGTHGGRADDDAALRARHRFSARQISPTPPTSSRGPTWASYPSSTASRRSSGSSSGAT